MKKISKTVLIGLDAMVAPLIDQYLAENRRRAPRYVRDTLRFALELFIIGECGVVDTAQIDGRRRSQVFMQNVLSLARFKSQRYNQRHDTRSDSRNRYDGNNRDQGLLSFGAEIAESDKKFEFHL